MKNSNYFSTRFANLLLLFFILSWQATAQNWEGYNILWITCEDISPNIGAYGDPVAKTPVLDQFASQGVTYTNVCSPSGVCSPSRAAIVTGVYPTSIGTHNMRTNWDTPDQLPNYEPVVPAEIKCFPEYLRAKGYFCTNNKKTDYQFKSPVTAWDENGGEAHYRHRAPGQPFFSVINIMDTHESKIWKHADHPLVVEPSEVEVPPYYPDTETVRTDIARNYSNIYEMDQKVGKILKELENEGVADSTIVIFYSDHGGPLPRQKREIINAGLQVPFIVRYPDGRLAGTTNDELISFLDLAPSMLDLAGVTPPEYMHGRVFLGDNKEAEPDYLYAARDRLDQQYDLVRAVRDKEFIYIRNYRPDQPWYMDVAYRKQMPMMAEMLSLYQAGQLNEVQNQWFSPTKPTELLYNFVQDPNEINNLAANPEYQEVLERMRKAHLAWEETYPDLGFTDELELVKTMWPGMVQPRTQVPYFEIEEGHVTINSSTEGGSIAYHTGISSDHWQLYTKPIEIKDSLLITAKAIRLGYKESPEISDIFVNEKQVLKATKQTLQTNIYPNPTTDLLTIKHKGFDQIRLYNTAGQLLWMQNEVAEKLSIDMTSYDSGRYQVWMIKGSQLMIRQIVKQ